MSKRKSVVGGEYDPLEAATGTAAPAARKGSSAKASASKEPTAPSTKKVRLVLWVQPVLYDQLRGAAMMNPERPVPSMSQLVERALRTELQKLWTKYNKGVPWTHSERLKGGRRVGS